MASNQLLSITSCLFLLSLWKTTFITSKWLWNVSLFFACHLISDSSSCYSFSSIFTFFFSSSALFVNYSFRKSARVSICFHNFLLLHLISFFCFSRNRDLKLIWMNMKFHGRLQNMLLSNYERIIIWKFQNQNKKIALKRFFLKICINSSH